MKRFAKKLFRMADQLAEQLDNPQDIEWAVANGQLFLLQSRPITTMQGYNPVTGVINDSLRGDYLWTNSNLGEAFPDVMTPITWSLIQIYGDEVNPLKLQGNHPNVWQYWWARLHEYESHVLDDEVYWFQSRANQQRKRRIFGPFTRQFGHSHPPLWALASH